MSKPYRVGDKIRHGKKTWICAGAGRSNPFFGRMGCAKCGKALKTPGALIFSPPINDNKYIPSHDVLKFHICRHCYSLLCDWLEESK